MTEEKKLEDFLPNKNASYYKKFDFKNEVSLISKEEIIKCIKKKNIIFFIINVSHLLFHF